MATTSKGRKGKGPAAELDRLIEEALVGTEGRASVSRI